MTAQPGRPQAPFTAGELAPALHDRRDLKYYRSGALYMRNVEVIPQGGFRQTPGSRQIARVRGNISPVSIAGATLFAPNGGVAGNAFDANAGTALVTGTISGALSSIVEIDFQTNRVITAVDLGAFFGTAAGSIAIQYKVGASWLSFDQPRALTGSARHRRLSAPPTQPVTAAQWRIVALNLVAPGTVSITEVIFWSEDASFGSQRLRPFMAADGSETLHVLSTHHADVVKDAWLCAYELPHDAQHMPALRTIQQLDTMILFHRQIAPHRILRQGADTEWQSSAAVLRNIPLYDYGGAYGNGVVAIWQVRLIGAPTDATADDFHYVITVNGEETPGLVVPLDGGGTGPDWTAFATAVANALTALPGIDPGITVTSPSAAVIDIQFTGADNAGNDWLVSMRCIDNATIACPAYLKTKGVKPGEAIISAGRGWPRCGTFYQQRMLMGGFNSLPNAWLASASGDFYNFDTGGEAATGAMLVPMDTRGGEAIEEIVAGRSLMIMTSQAEYFLAERAISKTSAPNHVETSRRGAASGLPSAENEGAAIFVQKSGGVLYEFRYDDIGQTFKTDNLSLLASHLIVDARDMAIRNATRDNDANQLHVVLGDGGMRVFALLRAQEVTAGMRRDTPGKFVAVANSDGSNRTAAITERPVGAAMRRFVERFDPDQLLDQAQTFTFGVPTAVITGLGDYEGATVWAIADDDVLGPFTVTGGVITLTQAATIVTIGRWTAPHVESLPLDRSIGPGIVLERRARIHTVHVSVIDSTSLAIRANGGKIYDVPLFRFGQQMDVPALQNKFTGVVKVQGLTGFADRPTVVITQKRPGYLNVRSITVEADL